MKEFIVTLQTRVADLQKNGGGEGVVGSSGGGGGSAEVAEGGLTKRARIMLEMVVGPGRGRHRPPRHPLAF